MTAVERANGESGRRSGPEPRTAILVLGCLLPVYDRCIRTIRATWGSTRRVNVDVFYVYGVQGTHGDPELVRIEDLIGQTPPELRDLEAWASGDIILCGAADVHAVQRDCILRKRLIAFGYLARQLRYDFVYTVCATSYVDVETLQRYVGGLPPTGVYHGPFTVESSGGIPFVSGASMLLSADIAAGLSDSAAAILAANAPAMPDDVAIGRWIADNCSSASAAQISSRICAGQKPTDDQTFVLPNRKGLLNYVDSPAHSHVPQVDAYHYHFHSRRMWEMEQFHHRHFAS